MDEQPSKKTVLLLHGWDWKKYPKFHPRHQWVNRQKFLDQLMETHNVDYPSMPGFSPADENKTGTWQLDDYSDWLQKQCTAKQYDAIIGYSFGCAVATHWQYKYRDKNIPLVLISPALSRALVVRRRSALFTLVNLSHRLKQTPLARWLRMQYLKRVVKNPYVIHASPFLARTYSNVVVVDLSPELKVLLNDGFRVTCIFGANDTATPPERLFERVPEVKALTTVIANGTHDIGGTHPDEIAQLVAKSIGT